MDVERWSRRRDQSSRTYYSRESSKLISRLEKTRQRSGGLSQRSVLSRIAIGFFVIHAAEKNGHASSAVVGHRLAIRARGLSAFFRLSIGPCSKRAGEAREEV